MPNKIKFALEDFSKFINDESPEFATAKIPFLSTNKNSHGITITPEVLKSSANTILGKFVIGEFDFLESDVTTHTDNQQIFGYFPKDQEIIFEEKNGQTIAIAYAVISKIYATKFYNLFLEENIRNTSVEMLVDWENEKEKIAKNFHITGVTVLGKVVKGSCPDAKIELVKFSEEEAIDFFESTLNKKSVLAKFSETRKRELMGKSYKVNKKELSMTAWGDIDKTKLRNTIMEASNRDSLVKDVYALVEAGWEDAPSEKLKYPIMELKGDTFYYNRYGLSSALAYARDNEEIEVINKIMTIYKKFNIGEEGGEKMSKEFKLGELEGRELYDKVIKIVQDQLGDHFYVETIYDDHIVVVDKKTDKTRNIPADIKVGKDDKDMKINIKFAEVDKKKMEDGCPSKKDIEEDEKADDELDHEELAKLKKDNEDKTDIIMAQTKELEGLRKFKEDTLSEAKSEKVKRTMAKVKEHLSEEDFTKFEKQGLECKFDELDGWTNSVLASITDKVLKMSSRGDSHFRIPVGEGQQSTSIWDKING